MTNGSDYLEIEQEQRQQIEEDYIKDIIEGREEIPEDYKTKWIDMFREG